MEVLVGKTFNTKKSLGLNTFSFRSAHQKFYPNSQNNLFNWKGKVGQKPTVKNLLDKSHHTCSHQSCNTPILMVKKFQSAILNLVERL